jgi:hypothetical protein
MSKLGRNDPCPCGSVKKYKHCHWLAEQETISDPERARRLHDLDGEIVNRLARFATREFGRGWMGDLLGPLDIDDDPDLSQLVGPCALYEWPSNAGTMAELLLASAPSDLSSRARGWLEAQGRAWLSVWEVLDVTPKVEVHVRDLLTGEERRVFERSASESLTPRDAFLGRVVDFEGLSVFCGMHPRTLPPRTAAGVVSALRKLLGVRSRTVSVARLRDEMPAGAWLFTWGEAVRMHDEARKILPQLTNTDGDPLLLTKDRFDFDSSVRALIDQKLMELTEDDDHESEREQRVFTFKKLGNAMHKTWDNTIVGRAVLERATLILETNSVRRADDLRKKIEGALQDLVRYRLRDHEDPAVRLREAESPARRGRPSKPNETQPPEVVEALRDIKQRHLQSWLDTAIPALSGMTPREAASKPRKRKDLIVLLKEIENHESRAPKEQQIDVSPLWTELGLEHAR